MFVCVVPLVVTALLFSLSACEVSAVKPGFQARITQHALDYVNQRAIDELAGQVQTARIPDQPGHSGHLSYSLTNIRITSFSKPSSSIKLLPHLGLSWSASNAGVQLESDWHVKYKHGWVKFSTSGSVYVTFTGVSFLATMGFSTDPTGRLSVKSGGCQSSVGHVSVKIHGDLHRFLNLFHSEVEKRVKSLLPGKLCDAANGLINNNAENQLNQIKVMAPLLYGLFVLDYRLVSPPSFQTAYMDTFHKGEITWTADPQPPPFPPSPLPPSPVSSNMLYLWVGEYVPQSFVYTAQKHGFLRYNMTTKDLPPAERAFLNTTCTDDPYQDSGVVTCIGLLFPPVAKKYPGRTVTLRMNSTMVPVINMAPDLLDAKMAGDIAVYVDMPTGPPPYVLTVSVSAMFNMTATINSQLIKGRITGSSFKVKVVDSAVGPLKSKVVNTLVGLAMKLFIIPKINEEGDHGLPLPVIDHIKFINTQLQVQQDAVMVATDLLYKP